MKLFLVNFIPALLCGVLAVACWQAAEALPALVLSVGVLYFWVRYASAVEG